MDQDPGEVVVQDTLASVATGDHLCDFHPQEGNLVMCKDGHGFFLPTDKMLTKDANGNFQIVDIVFQDISATL